MSVAQRKTLFFALALIFLVTGMIPFAIMFFILGMIQNH